VSTLAIIGLTDRAAAQGPAPAAAPPPATSTECLFYPTNTILKADLLKPGMLPPCAPAVTGGTPGFPDPLNSLQHGFDLYSWLTFVALNSPADGKNPIGKDTGPTVWQNYKPLADVMLENGQRPKDWDAPGNVPGIRG
jgi:hypothetical protein